METKNHILFWYTTGINTKPGDELYYNVSVHNDGVLVCSYDYWHTQPFTARMAAISEYSSLTAQAKNMAPGGLLVELNIQFKTPNGIAIMEMASLALDFPGQAKKRYRIMNNDDVVNHWMNALQFEFDYYIKNELAFTGYKQHISDCFIEPNTGSAFGEIQALPGSFQLYDLPGLKMENNR